MAIHNSTPAMALTETPEFKAALDAALKDALGRLAPSPAGAQSSALEFADRLSVQLAKLTGQGVGQAYVDPEIIARRKDAHRRMRELLSECAERHDKPKWRLVGQIHMPLGGVGYAIIQPLYRDAATKKQMPTEVSFYGEPNLAMRPANGAAERIWALFCASIGRTEEGEDGEDETDDLGGMALTISGAVVRGNAAATWQRHDPAAHEDAVTIESGDDPQKRHVRIFTAMPPVEMA